jgi:hypothetical protein
VRKALIVIIAIVAVLSIAGAIYWHEINVAPNITIPKPPPSPSPNAYDSFFAARALDRDSGKWNFAAGSRLPGYKDPDDPDDRYYSLAEKEELLRENLPMIAKVRQGLSYDYSPSNSKLPFIDSGFGSIREEARMFSFAGKVYGEEGKWKDALRTDVDGVQLGEKVNHNEGLIGLLVAIACQAIARHHAWDTVDHLSAADARGGALRLESIQASKFPLAQTLQNEKWNMLATIMPAFRKDSIIRIGLYFTIGSHVTFDDYRRLLPTSKRAVIGNYVWYMDAYSKRCSLPYGASMKLPPLVKPPDPFNNEIIPDLDLARFRDADNDTQNNLLMASLALRAYQADHGSYPASLSQLVPSYLHSLPSDPFAVSGPLRYRKTGSKYVLYSVGPDGVDDGGKPIVDQSQSGERRTMVEPDSKGDIVAGVNIY